MHFLRLVVAGPSKRSTHLDTFNIGPHHFYTHSNTNSEMTKTDYKTIFPTNKIKAQIRCEENIGKIYTSAVDLVAAASALFLEKLIQSVASEESCQADNKTKGALLFVTKEKLELAAQKEEFSFLHVEIDPKALSKYNKYRKKAAIATKKKDPKAKPAAMQKKRKAEVLDVQGANVAEMFETSSSMDKAQNKQSDGGNVDGLDLKELVKGGSNLGEIIEDDEDYD